MFGSKPRRFCETRYTEVRQVWESKPIEHRYTTHFVEFDIEMRQVFQFDIHGLEWIRDAMGGNKAEGALLEIDTLC